MCPRISIVVPCYNLGPALGEVMAHIVTQPYDDLEAVIVDDGSTDSATKALLVQCPWPNARVVHTDHRGPAAAKNCGFEHATAPYVSVVEPGYRLANTFLETTASLLDADDTLTFVSGWVEILGTDTSVWAPERCDFPTLLGECTVAQPALVRKSAVTAIGGLDEHSPVRGFEDWDLWVTLVEQGHRGAIVPQVLFNAARLPLPMTDADGETESHLALMRYLIAKHETSYRQHLFDVLLQKEAVSCDLLKTTYALDRHLDGWLVPLIARRREELGRLERKLEEAEQQAAVHDRVSRLQKEVAASSKHADESARARAHAEHEVAALRNSLSWRLTAPLRTALDLLRWPTRR